MRTSKREPGPIARANMAERRAERWRPPPFAPPPRTRLQHLLAALRRFLDLQAASLWRDLSRELPLLRGTVLDVGCGAQPYRGLLAPGAAYIGVDRADARGHFGYDLPDVRYYEGETLPVETGSIDAVLCTETLEHVLEPPCLLGEIRRCLRPGGRLVLTVPFAARWHFLPRDYWRFTPSALEHLLGEAGFADVRVFARGNAMTVACYKVIALCLPLLLPQAGGAIRHLLRLLGLSTLPLIGLLAALAHASLAGQGGDDCLGYTVLAVRDGSTA